jgi:hypothetical protein
MLSIAPSRSLKGGAHTSAHPGALSAEPRSQDFFISWCITCGTCLFALVFAILALPEHTKSHDLAGYFLLLGGSPFALIGGHRWLVARHPESAPSALRGLTLVVSTAMLASWLSRDPGPLLLWWLVAASWAGVMLPLRSERVANALAEGPLARLAELMLMVTPGALVLFSVTFHPSARALLTEWLKHSRTFYVGCVPGLAIAIYEVARSTRREPKEATRALRWPGLALILLCCLSMLDVDLGVDTFHYGAYLGPANAVLHGRVPLLGAHCQYGLAYLVYAIAFAGGLPLSYAGAGLVTSLVSVASYLAFMLSLRRLVRSWPLWLTAAICIFFFQNLIGYDVNGTPSVSGLRFFPVNLLLLTLLCLPSNRSFTAWSVAATVLCVLWSVEALVFGLFAHMTVLVARSLLRRESWQQIGGLVGGVAGLGVLPHALLSLSIRLWFGEWPRYQDSLGMVGAHLEDQLPWLILLDPRNLSWLPVVLCYVVVIAVTIRSTLARETRLPVSSADELAQLFLIAALGTAELATFAARTYWTILAMVSLPSFLLALTVAERGLASSAWRRTTALTLVVVLPLLSGVTLATFRPEGTHHAPSTGLVGALVSEPRSTLHAVQRALTPGFGSHEQNMVYDRFSEAVEDPYLREGFSALDRWTQGEREVLLFTPQDTPLLFLSRRVHQFPISNAVNDDLSPSLTDRILHAPVTLRAGEPVFIARDLNQLVPLQRALLLRILEQWNLRRVEMGAVIGVYRLEARPLGAPPLKSLKEAFMAAIR